MTRILRTTVLAVALAGLTNLVSAGETEPGVPAQPEVSGSLFGTWSEEISGPNGVIIPGMTTKPFGGTDPGLHWFEFDPTGRVQVVMWLHLTTLQNESGVFPVLLRPGRYSYANKVLVLRRADGTAVERQTLTWLDPNEFEYTDKGIIHNFKRIEGIPVPNMQEAEKRAAATLQKLGATVTRDETKPGKPVVAVRIGGFMACKDDEAMRLLAPLQNLTSLSLYLSLVTDKGLENLVPLQNLTALKIGVCPVTDAGLKHLAALPKLTTLDLGDSFVTDAGLKELAALKGLKTLRLGGTKVTDAGVEALQKALPKCKIVR